MSLIQIKNRFTGSVLFEHTVEGNTVLITILQAISVRADLTRADLTGANLTGANLTRADLTRANLTGADLTDANLTRANLTGADLTGADLTGANLTRANLTGANLRPIKHDLFGVLLYAQHEAQGMLEALKIGKVNGSTYSGECACLVGTLCNVRGINADQPATVIGMPKDSDSAIERWFMAIRPGDTPENSVICRITADWVTEFIALTNSGQPTTSAFNESN